MADLSLYASFRVGTRIAFLLGVAKIETTELNLRGRGELGRNLTRYNQKLKREI